MTNFNFKAGEKVYCPSVSNKVLTLDSNADITYAISLICADGNKEVFTSDGKRYSADPNPSMFPATEEWHDKLITTYPNIEKPPVKKLSKEIIQAMLNDKWDSVPCYVHNEKKIPSHLNGRELIIEARDYEERPFFSNTTTWRYATPFDPKTGKVIVDYVDGEVVLESEND